MNQAILAAAMLGAMASMDAPQRHRSYSPMPIDPIEKKKEEKRKKLRKIAKASKKRNR